MPLPSPFENRRRLLELLDDDDTAPIIDNQDDSTDIDLCRCGHPRSEHDDGKNDCSCGRCRKFKDMA